MKDHAQLTYHLFQFLGIDLSVYHGKDNLYAYQVENTPQVIKPWLNAIYASFLDQIQSLQDPLIIKHVYAYDLSFCAIKGIDEIMIIGPFLEQEYHIDALNRLLVLCKADAQQADLITRYYDRLRILSSSDLRFIQQVYLSYQPYDPDQTIKSLSESYDPSDPKRVLSESSEDIEIYVRNNYAFEASMMSALQDGNPDAVREALKTASIYLPDRVPRDTLRNTKNRMIILNTISTRRAIEAGLDIYHAHRLSTQYGIEIEQMKHAHETEKMSQKILIGFAEAIRDYGMRTYPELIRQALIHIHSNISANLSLEDVADALFVTKSHLARSFKLATGKTVQDTIRSYKILEAKKLIEQHELSMTDISEMLNFASPSHFSQTFKRYVGLSPETYKKTH